MNNWSKAQSERRMASGVMSDLMREGLRILYMQGWGIDDLADRYDKTYNEIVKLLKQEELVIAEDEQERKKDNTYGIII